MIDVTAGVKRHGSTNSAWRPRRSASTWAHPSWSDALAGSSTATNRSSPARRSISATASFGYSCGTAIIPRSRESNDSHSSACQSFTAAFHSAAKSGWS